MKFQPFRCLLATWVVVYAVALVVGDVALVLIARASGHVAQHLPAIVSALAAVLSAVALEIAIVRASEPACSGIPRLWPMRVLMYVVAFFAGFLMWLGLTVSFDVPLLPRVAVLILTMVPLASLLLLHVIETHRRASMPKATNVLRQLARLPLYVLVLIVFGVLALNLVELLRR